MVRVHINDVAVHKPMGELVDGRSQALKLAKSAEGFSHLDASFLQSRESIVNPLILAVFTAFAEHVPLELSPDVVFNTVLQGISQHVATNPEHFRDVFVAHEGQKDLVTRDDSLVKGSWENRWEKSILDLGSQIREDMSEQEAKRVISTTFSTTGLTEQTAHTAVFMDIVKKYYRYTVFTMCGIPWIDITGTKDDWVLLGETIDPLLTALKLTSWNAEVQNIISHFARAFDGDVDKQHWNRIYYYHGAEESGDVSKVSGWIAKLFLYVRGHLNPLIGKPDESVPEAAPRLRQRFAGKPWLDHKLWQPKTESLPQHETVDAIELADFACGTTRTAFTWNYYGKKIPMELIAGHVGVSVTANGSLKPEIGWLVGEAHKDELSFGIDSDSDSYSVSDCDFE